MPYCKPLEILYLGLIEITNHTKLFSSFDQRIFHVIFVWLTFVKSLCHLVCTVLFWVNKSLILSFLSAVNLITGLIRGLSDFLFKFLFVVFGATSEFMSALWVVSKWRIRSENTTVVIILILLQDTVRQLF